MKTARIAACVLGLLASIVLAQPPPPPAEEALLCRVKVLVEEGLVPHGGGLNAELEALGTRLERLPAGADRALAARVGLTGWYRVALPGAPRGYAAHTAPRWLATYAGIFERVEVDTLGGVCGGPDSAPDPLFAGQWGLRNAGKPPESLPDYDIDADAGWRLLEALAAAGYELAPVTLALIDDGYSPLAWAPSWGNRDMPRALPGFNTVNGSANTPSGCGAGHGTHVASIALAHVGNGYGMAGVCVAPVSIRPYKVLDSCWGHSSACAQAIVRCADDGADVANLSLQYSPPHPAYFVAAAEYAYARGVVLVAAAGNWSGAPQAAPAAFKPVLGVNAGTRQGLRAVWSNTGGDLIAPGAEITGLVNGGAYQEWSGTSMAAPMVAGIALTMRSLNPALSVDRVRQGLTQTASTWPLWTPHNGFGMPSLYRAVLWSVPRYADFNRDGTVDLADVAAFHAAWSRGEERANCDGSLDDQDLPTFGVGDMVCFQLRWVEGW